MLEVLVLLVFTLFLVWGRVDFTYLTVFIFLLLLILPGTYALFFGAPYIRSDDKRIDGILKLAKLKKSDKVYDLGCGDGKLIRAVASAGVENSIGYELSIPTFLLAKYLCIEQKSSAKVLFGNFWRKDVSDADVIVCFLLGPAMERFYREIWPNLKAGTRVVSYEFEIPGLDPSKSLNRVYLYIKN